MTTFRMANELAAVMVPLGIIGAALAVVCAIVAGAAIMRGAVGLSGGAVGVWIPFALLSFTASFANQWVPLLVAGAALVAMLIIGGVVRGIVKATASARRTRPVVHDSARTPKTAGSAGAIPGGIASARPVLAEI